MTWNSVPTSWAEMKVCVHLDEPSRMQTEGRGRDSTGEIPAWWQGGAGHIDNNKPMLTCIYQWLILGHCLMDEGSFKKRDFKRATWCAELTYICAQCTICSYHGNPPKHTGRQQAAPLQCRKGNLPPAGKALKAADALWHKLKPQANCYWVEPLWRFSRLQSRKHTPVSLLPTNPATYKNKFLCPHIKNCKELTPAQRKVFKKSTFHWKTQMGECFKTKQRLTAHTTFAVRAELNCPWAEEHVRFFLPWLEGKKLAPCVSPTKGNVSWSLSFRLKNML